MLLGLVVATALVFDFTNGFHDTATAAATSVSTRALSPRSAVALAAVMNFVRLGGVLTVLAVGGLFAALWRQERRKARQGAATSR